MGKSINVATPFDEQIKEAEMREYIASIDKRNACEERVKYIIENKLYRPMDEYEEAFNSVANSDDRHPAIVVELVIRKKYDVVDDEHPFDWKKPNMQWGDPEILVADDAGDYEFPRVRDGKFYWNTYNCGIWEWSKEDNSYVHWFYRNKKEIDILGFISIREWRDEE